MAKIGKRGRGRPTRMDKLIHDLQQGVVKGQEDLALVYDEAIQILIGTMRSNEASVTNKLQAARCIKEYIEATLESYEKEDEESESQDDESSGVPILKIE